MQRDDQGRQPRPDHTPFAQGHRIERWVIDQAFAGTRARVMTAAAQTVIKTMVGAPQVQARLRGIVPHQID